MQEASASGNQAQLSAPVLRRQSSLGQEEAPAWTGRRLAIAASVTLAGGSIAGLLGIGGGMVMGACLCWCTVASAEPRLNQMGGCCLD